MLYFYSGGVRHTLGDILLTTVGSARSCTSVMTPSCGTFSRARGVLCCCCVHACVRGCLRDRYHVSANSHSAQTRAWQPALSALLGLASQIYMSFKITARRSLLARSQDMIDTKFSVVI
jgi:hypothetical protein